VHDEPGFAGHHPWEPRLLPWQVHGHLRRLSNEPEPQVQHQGRCQVGHLQLAHQGRHGPHVDMFNSASADMVDINLSIIFRTLPCSQNYPAHSGTYEAITILRFTIDYVI
jgi:hypothetical protein